MAALHIKAAYHNTVIEDYIFFVCFTVFPCASMCAILAVISPRHGLPFLQ